VLLTQKIAQKSKFPGLDPIVELTTLPRPPSRMGGRYSLPISSPPRCLQRLGWRRFVPLSRFFTAQRWQP